jgi:hypothetical protein
MAQRKSLKSSNYAVGYARPPKATQFKVGKSGNPTGRPRGARGVGSILQDVIRQKIAVTENGKTRRIPALEVMLRRLANDAMRSDPKALKLLLSLVDRYAESPSVDVDINEILAEDKAILAEFLQRPRANATSRKGSRDGNHAKGV